MLSRAQYIVLTALAALALLLVAANAALFTLNRGTQNEVAARQQFVQQSVQLEALYREIVKGLAELAVKGNDAQIMQMLNAQGINVNAAPPAAAPVPPTPAPNR